MKKSFFFLLFLFIATTWLSAQTQNNNEQAKIQQSVTGFFDGLSALDTIIVKQYITRDFLLFEDGTILNMDSIVNAFNDLKNQLNGASFTRVNHLDFIQTEVKGNSAWVAYNNTADFTIHNVDKMKVQWLESAFLVKEGTDWKIRFLHSTEVKPKDQ